MDEHTKCQTLFMNLLLYLDGESQRKLGPNWYVRTFLETEGCEGAKDLMNARMALRARIPGGSGIDASQDGDYVVRSRSLQAIWQYQSWHRRILYSSLDWPNWMAYTFRSPKVGGWKIPSFDDY
jgi:hypothetical protein